MVWVPISRPGYLESVCQEPDIPGLLGELHKIEICYFEDETGAEIGAVFVTARDNNTSSELRDLAPRGDFRDHYSIPDRTD